MNKSWDVALSGTAKGYMQIRIPTELARLLIARGYTHVEITVEEKGILLRPYTAEVSDEELPEWLNQ